MAEDIQELLNYAYFYLKFRPRTKREMELYLLKKIQKRFWSQGHVKQAIAKLEEQNFLNDKAFIEWYVEQRNRAKPKSEFVLHAELLKYGAQKEDIDRFFEEYAVDEDVLAVRALERKWMNMRSLSREERFKKSYSFLARRGFSYDTIKKTIEKAEEKE